MWAVRDEGLLRLFHDRLVGMFEHAYGGDDGDTSGDASKQQQQQQQQQQLPFTANAIHTATTANRLPPVTIVSPLHGREGQDDMEMDMDMEMSTMSPSAGHRGKASNPGPGTGPGTGTGSGTGSVYLGRGLELRIDVYFTSSARSQSHASAASDKDKDKDKVHPAINLHKAGKRPQPSAIIQHAGPQTCFLVCGPAQMSQDVVAAAAKANVDVHNEIFNF